MSKPTIPIHTVAVSKFIYIYIKQIFKFQKILVSYIYLPITKET